MKYLLLGIMLLLVQCSNSQKTYSVPFASSNNTIELSIRNTANTVSSPIVAEVTEAPEWLQFSSRKIAVSNVEPNGVSIAEFKFSVQANAPLDEKHDVKIVVKNENGNRVDKIYIIQVSLLLKYSLEQNYPNPFNPSTTISYALPHDGFVTLKVYDMLGREVSVLVNSQQSAGTYSAQFDASKLATGMYVYKLSSDKFTSVKKMMLLK